MKDEYAEKISALMDNEVDSQQASSTIELLRDNEQARKRWARYNLVSDTLRNNLPDRVDVSFSQRVSQLLENEPVILAPRRSQMPTYLRHAAGFAVAATVAVVAVLVAQQQGGVDPAAPQLATIAVQPSANSEWVRVNVDNVKWTTQQPAVESRLNAYLVNHNGYTTSVRGILPYAPIVSSPGHEPVQQQAQDQGKTAQGDVLQK